MATELKKDIESIEFDLSELSSLEVLAKRQNVKTLLSSEVNRLNQKKSQLLVQWKQLTASEGTGDCGERSDSGSGRAVGQPSKGSVIVTNYMWDQSQDFVKVYIEIDKNYSLDSTQIEMSFQNKRSFCIVFGKYKFTISRLFEDIDSTKSYHKLTKSGKLIIYLKKLSPKQWTTIDQKDNKLSKKAVNDDKEDDLNADPSAGLMKLMKQMYDEGDDDMKRTIAKSWYESRNKNGSEVDIKSDDSLNI